MSRHQKCVQTTTLFHVVQASWVPSFVPSRDCRSLAQVLLWPAKWNKLSGPPTSLLIYRATSLRHWCTLFLTAGSFATHGGLSLLLGDATLQPMASAQRALPKTQDAYLLSYSGHFLLVFLKLITPFTFKIYPFKSTFYCCYFCLFAYFAVLIWLWTAFLFSCWPSFYLKISNLHWLLPSFLLSLRFRLR